MTKAKKLAGAGDVVVHVQSSKKKGKKRKIHKENLTKQKASLHP